jgi:hypothetical protein
LLQMERAEDVEDLGGLVGAPPKAAEGNLCNTPGVYIPLDNEYGIKHVISVDKTDVKF